MVGHSGKIQSLSLWKELHLQSGVIAADTTVSCSRWQSGSKILWEFDRQLKARVMTGLLWMDRQPNPVTVHSHNFTLCSSFYLLFPGCQRWSFKSNSRLLFIRLLVVTPPFHSTVMCMHQLELLWRQVPCSYGSKYESENLAGMSPYTDHRIFLL